MWQGFCDALLGAIVGMIIITMILWWKDMKWIYLIGTVLAAFAGLYWYIKLWII